MMSDLPDAERQLLRRLTDESACRQLLASYTYAVDWMNWSGLETLFWPDAEFDFGMWSGPRDQFVPWVTDLESGYQRRLHHFSMPRLGIEGDRGHAEVGSLMFMRLPGESGAGKDELIAGRYQFGFTRREGEWRMSALQFLMHGAQQFPAVADGGADFFADGLTPDHPRFLQPALNSYKIST